MVTGRNSYIKIIIVLFALLATATCNKFSKHYSLDKEIYQVTSHLESDVSIVYRKAYFQGMQEAYDEIKNNNITRYVYGKGNWGEVDKETGIPIKVIAGCIVSDSVFGRTEGHNYIILKYLKHEIR